MSFDIGGVGPAQGAPRVVPTATAKSAGAAATPASAADDAVEVQTFPPAPPASVMHAISVAGEAYQQLHDSGRNLHFSTDPRTGRLSAQLQDLDGTPLATVTPSQVLAIASGEPA